MTDRDDDDLKTRPSRRRFLAGAAGLPGAAITGSVALAGNAAVAGNPKNLPPNVPGPTIYVR